MQRFKSLDIFRGMTILLMIVVNSAGNGAPPFAFLEHAEWFGFTLADLVFPSFLFAMGSSLAFSNATNLGNLAYIKKVLWRGCLIFIIGILLAWFPFFIFNRAGEFEWKYFENLRLMGVLQRIAIAYIIAAFTIKFANQSGIIFAIIFILLSYWIALIFGAPQNLAFDKMQNLGTKIDLFIIPQNHLYRRDGGFEPEGILGSIVATTNVLGGFLAGQFIKTSKDHKYSLKHFILIGMASIIIGIYWANWFPIGKKLWTSSFVLVCIGLDLLILSALLYWVEVGRKSLPTIFESFGRNPLMIYVFSIALIKILMAIQIEKGKNLYTFLSADLMQIILPNAWGSLLFACAITMVCAFFALYLDKKNIIIKI